MTGRAELFLGRSKVETFRRDLAQLREACRREGTPAVQDAWDRFEPWTDCINPNPQPAPPPPPQSAPVAWLRVDGSPRPLLTTTPPPPSK